MQNSRKLLVSITDKKYVSLTGQNVSIFDRKKYIQNNLIQIMWTKPQGDSNSWPAVHRPYTLTTELWQYSIDTNNLPKQINRHRTMLSSQCFVLCLSTNCCMVYLFHPMLRFRFGSAFFAFTRLISGVTAPFNTNFELKQVFLFFDIFS